MSLSMTGRARRFGDDINTDYIISSSRKRETIEQDELKQWLLEAVDADFASSVRDGDVIVAGERFGSGSAMEVAVTVVLAAGIRAVVAESFSRTFFRNAINNGLWPIECETAGIGEGDSIRVEVSDAGIRLVDDTLGTSVEAMPLAPFARGILEAGGIVPYLSGGGAFGGTT